MIVVGVDGSMAARAAVEWAAGDALRAHVPLRVVHAVDRSPYQIDRFGPADRPDAPTREGRRALDEALALARERQPGVEVTTALVEGSPDVVLREEAVRADELVVGSRGLGGLTGALLGSVSAHLAGRVACPVVAVRAERHPVRGEVAVGVDDSPGCEAALEYAFAQARLRGAALRVVHAWQLPVHAFAPEISYEMDQVRAAQHEAVVGRLAAFERRHPGVRVVEDAPCRQPVDALTAASAGADLLVVGSHGRGAVGAALLGSVSRGVLHHARCAVAVVRHHT
ncbi:universal stress protein [Nonomuraea roseoviolacea subsp. roseoviolacea]|uniref:universal stress protein n=1 Tax=Nonomuraea roseoviolacea TaxID=103837 RepID=UPI0031D9EC8E